MMYYPSFCRHFCAGTEQAGLKCRKAQRKCEDYEFHCANQECIHVNNLCDGTADCGDSSDELSTNCQAPLQVRLSDGPNSRSGRYGTLKIVDYC